MNHIDVIINDFTQDLVEVLKVSLDTISYEPYDMK